MQVRRPTPISSFIQAFQTSRPATKFVNLVQVLLLPVPHVSSLLSILSSSNSLVQMNVEMDISLYISSLLTRALIFLSACNATLLAPLATDLATTSVTPAPAATTWKMVAVFPGAPEG